MRTVIVTIALALAATGIAAAGGVSLVHVAAADGYTMRWLGPERSVCLSRNGLVVVVRPGSVFYDVNSREEIADRAPVSTGAGDLQISDSFARRLGALAKGTQAPNPSAERVIRSADPASGTVVVGARQITGRHALLVQGSAPRNARVTLTLLATLSPDLPTVFLGRNDVQADSSGRFAAIVSLAPDYFPGSLVTLVATSDGSEPASTHLVLDGAL